MGSRCGQKKKKKKKHKKNNNNKKQYCNEYGRSNYSRYLDFAYPE